MDEVKHTNVPSQATKYRQLSKLRKDLNIRIKAKENPNKVFGEEEVKKLLEDCNSSTREILKIIKWLRHCFGRQHFAPKIQAIISEHLNIYYNCEFKPIQIKSGKGSEPVIQSHTSFNSLRVGSPNRIMTIRKNKSPNSPLAIPN
jgi:hypothetical protein